MRGANSDSSARGSVIVSLSLSMMNRRDFFASTSASRMISIVIPATLMSIWIAVIPSTVPATLKSISPSASSRPWMSVRIAYLSPLRIEPHRDARDVPLIGTPASSSASVEPQTDAIDDDPFDSSTSLITRSVYGNSSSAGSTGTSARSASCPWPISRRPGARIGRVSPTEYGGKL